jgi:hypothetical protein
VVHEDRGVRDEGGCRFGALLWECVHGCGWWWCRLAKKYHPDANKEDPQAQAMFQEVQKAYETLRDPEKRGIYDQV